MLKRSASVRSDVWSLGCVLGFVLTGGVPLFDGSHYDLHVQSMISLLGSPDERTWRDLAQSADGLRLLSASRGSLFLLSLLISVLQIPKPWEGSCTSRTIRCVR